MPMKTATKKARVEPRPSFAFRDLDQFIVGMTNSAPSFTPARARAAEGEDAQTENRPANSSSE
ncbi:hypothetical protein [Mesorhizobium sp. M1348]|uniref:hypothetical protein n=1 Tax=unclassified Mesorhizobium TaxID=325217 RepID=UPI00333D95FA